MSADVDAKDILELVGNTPVVAIRELNPNPEVTILAKLEGFNPCGSVKDRIALYMIEGAEERGELYPGKIILEPTSGNTGIGLAMVASIKGYPLKVLMPETMSIERRRILQAFGAEVVLTPGDEGMNGAIARGEELAGDERYYIPNQFANSDNVKAHYEGTGGEILDQAGDVNVFVAGIGTGGTITGVGRRLKEELSGVRVVGVEPYPDSGIQGLRNLEAFVPPIFDLSVMDEKVNVDDQSAFYMSCQLVSKEGLFVGISSGAAMCEAYRQARLMERGTVVVVFPDRGERYLSTACFQGVSDCPYLEER